MSDAASKYQAWVKLQGQIDAQRLQARGKRIAAGILIALALWLLFWR